MLNHADIHSKYLLTMIKMAKVANYKQFKDKDLVQFY